MALRSGQTSSVTFMKQKSNCLICNEGIVGLEQGLGQASLTNVNSLCELLQLPQLGGLELGSAEAFIAFCDACSGRVDAFNLLLVQLNGLMAQVEGIRREVSQQLLQSTRDKTGFPYIVNTRNLLSSQFLGIQPVPTTVLSMSGSEDNGQGRIYAAVNNGQNVNTSFVVVPPEYNATHLQAQDENDAQGQQLRNGDQYFLHDVHSTSTSENTSFSEFPQPRFVLPPEDSDDDVIILDNNETDSFQAVNRRRTDSCQPVKRRKTDSCQPVNRRRTDSCQPVKRRKTDACQPIKRRRTDSCQPVKRRKTDACQPVNRRRTDSCQPVKRRKTDACQPIKRRKTDSCQPVNRGKTDSCEPVNRKKEVKCAHEACPTPFETENEIRRHFESHYLEMFQCAFCPRVCKTLNFLRMHMERLHPSMPIEINIPYQVVPPPFKCSYLNCVEGFGDKEKLAKHRRTKHTRTIQCTHEGCTETFEKRHDMYIHKRKVHTSQNTATNSH